MRATAVHIVPAILAAGILVTACGPSDPEAAIHEQRARWDVRVLNWAQDSEGNLWISTRVSGPSHSPLNKLTVRLVLLDGSDAEVGEHWHTFDLAGIPRGGPRDLDLPVPAGELEVEGVAVDFLLAPTEAQRARIPELRD